jgi:nucleoside-diphosphate-sugar epimerase
MRILVTGSDGYIGAVACPLLMAAGHDVVGLDTGYYRQGWLFEPGGPQPKTLTMDIRDVTPSDLAGFDAVVHMAELSNDPLSQQSPDLTRDINHQGTMRLARAARAAGVGRFVYMSSCSVYGLAEDGAVMTEQSPVNPQTVYAECKVLVERDLAKMAGPDFTPVFLRNATVYGASPRQRFDVVLNDLCGRAWTDGVIRLLSDGSPWRPLVHVEDVCGAVRAAVTAPAERVSGIALNVGSDDQNYRVIEIAMIVKAAFPGATVDVGPPSADNRSYRVGFGRIGAELPDFRCCWTAEQGARQMRDLFAQIGLDRTVFGAAPFTRLAMIGALRERGLVGDDLRWTALQAESSAA